jgi:hypothetical protein
MIINAAIFVIGAYFGYLMFLLWNTFVGSFEPLYYESMIVICAMIGAQLVGVWLAIRDDVVKLWHNL